MRALKVLQLIGGGLAVDVRGTSLDVVARHEPPPLLLDHSARGLSSDGDAGGVGGRVRRVADPAGFRWHVQRDGQTVSPHPTKAEADRMAALLRSRHP